MWFKPLGTHRKFFTETRSYLIFNHEFILIMGSTKKISTKLPTKKYTSFLQTTKVQLYRKAFCKAHKNDYKIPLLNQKLLATITCCFYFMEPLKTAPYKRFTSETKTLYFKLLLVQICLLLRQWLNKKAFFNKKSTQSMRKMQKMVLKLPIQKSQGTIRDFTKERFRNS